MRNRERERGRKGNFKSMQQNMRETQTMEDRKRLKVLGQRKVGGGSWGGGGV